MRRIGLAFVVAVSLLVVATAAAQTSEVEILSKADAIRLFSTPKAEWLQNVRGAVAVGAAKQTGDGSLLIGMAYPTAETDIITVNLDYSKGDLKPRFVQLVIAYRQPRAARFTDRMIKDAIAAAQRQMEPEFELVGNAERIQGGRAFYFHISDKCSK